MAEYTDTIISVLKQLDLDIPESIRTDQRLTTWLMYRVEEKLAALKERCSYRHYRPISELGEIDDETLDMMRQYHHILPLTRVIEVEPTEPPEGEEGEGGEGGEGEPTEPTEPTEPPEGEEGGEPPVVINIDIPFTFLNEDAEQTICYFGGMYVDELGVAEYYLMEVEIDEETGAGIITSIKDASGTETIEDWKTLATTAVVFKPL